MLGIKLNQVSEMGPWAICREFIYKSHFSNYAGEQSQIANTIGWMSIDTYPPLLRRNNI